MILIAVLLIILMALFGTPIYIVISAFALLGFYVGEIPLPAMVVDIYDTFANKPLLYTIPLFTFAGYILAESKTSNRIVNLSKATVGWLPGGLAIVSLIACAFFTAFTGASGVTIIAFGGLLFPALIQRKYPEKFSLGLLTSSGSLGLLFPPSLPIILFCAISEASVYQLFAAGIVPGILLIFLLSIYSMFISRRNKIQLVRFSFPYFVQAIKEAKWELFIPVIIVGGIFGGFVTLGEVAVITILYALFIEVFIYKEIELKALPAVMQKSMVLVGGILIIMGSAYGLTNYMIDAEIPMVILKAMSFYITSKYVFLLALNIFLLIVGCVLDIYSAIFVVVPLILPIAATYDINVIHLGIIFLTNLEIGYSTPPVGMNLFISCMRFQKSVIALYRASIPFIIILFIGLMIITYIPALSLFWIEYFGIK